MIERGSADNAFLGFDESDDKFIVGTGSFTGASTGSLTITTGTLKANIEGNLTGNVTGTATNATHVNVADNESTDENNLIPFIEDTSATGNVGLESDGDLHYNPSTGRLTATQLAGTLQTAAQGNITSVGTLTALQVDNININGNTIISSDTNGHINLTPNGSGNVVISSADINGGAIDATNITVGSGKTLDVSGGTLTLANDQISGNAINGGTIGSITINALAGNLGLGDNNITAVGSIALDSIESASTGNGFDLTLLDNKADALEIKEGSNAYMTFITTDGSEEIQIDKALDINAAVDMSSTLTVGGDVTFKDESDAESRFLFDVGGSGDNPKFIVYNNDGSTEDFKIDNGTITSVSGATFGGTITQTVSSGTNDLIMKGDSNKTITLSQADGTMDAQVEGNSSNLLLTTRRATPIVFGINNSEKMRLDSSGNVGIGGNPVGLLTVSDSATPEILLNDTGGTSNKRVFRISGGGDTVFFEGRNNDNSGAGAVGGDGSIMSMSLDDGQVTFFHDIELNGSGTRQIRFDDGAVSEGAIVFDETTNGFIFKVGGTSGSGKIDALKIDNTGQLSIVEKIIHSGDDDTFIRFTDNQINFSAGNATPVVFTSNQVQATTGSESTPSFTFNGDSDTGMYRDAGNQLGFATGGTKRLDISSSGVATFTSNVRSMSASGGEFTMTREVDSSIVADEELGRISFAGGESSGASQAGASIRAICAGTWGVNALPTKLEFYTQLVGDSGNQSKRWTIFDDGDFIPGADNSHDIGHGSFRVKTIFTNNSVNVSDRTLKENIRDCQLGLNFVNNLEPKSFNMKLEKSHENYGKERFGFIAQDLLETPIKDAVFGEKDGEYNLSYTDLIAPLVKAVQELSAKVEKLEKTCKDCC